MLNFVERSAIKLLKKRGNTDTEIARALGRDRKTVKQALLEPADKELKRPKRGSVIDPYEDKILEWIQEGIPVTVMLERIKKDQEEPYQGGKSIFYQRVKHMRQEQKMTKQKAIWTYEGLPGEYLQVDWGERRQFPFTQIPQTTRYCFVGRLKYSRWIYTEFQDNMRYETLIRCILRCLENLGGVPWVLVFDNMSTIVHTVAERDKDGNPVWNQKFRQFSSEIGFHPDVCDPGAPNQKGTVENGVKFVKRNFLAGRTFRDDADLSAQSYEWILERNSQKCQAHGHTPNDLLPEELKALGSLTETADSYGLLHLLRVYPESVVRFETNCYSVPEGLIGLVLAARVTSNELKIYHDNQLVAQHERSYQKRQRVRDLEHYQRTLSSKPRAKVMAYREKLLELDSSTAIYVAEICHRDRNSMNQQILRLYALWKEHGTESFLEAVHFCNESQVYGWEYVQLMLRIPEDEGHDENGELEFQPGFRNDMVSDQPEQSEIDRDLAVYDTYSHR
jgi:transposase